MLKSRDSFERTSFKMNIHAFVLLVFICTRYGCDAGKDKTSSKVCQNILENMEKNSQSFARLEATVAKQLTDLKSELSDKQDTLYTTMRMIMLKDGENLALNRPATQSSISGGGAAGRATDGNKNGNWIGRSCTHTTEDVNPWWRVDLGHQVLINKVVITNRKDCCGERLHDLILTVSDTTNGEEVECGRYKGPSTDGAIETIQCAPGTMGRFLKIQINGTYQLALCEVEVY